MRYDYVLVIVLLSTGVMNVPAFSYDENIVHRNINENATQQSSTDSYLKKQPRMPNGIDEIVNKAKIRQWLSSGGKTEDNSVRPLNHFHDPLKEWGDAGMTVSHSSLVWAQLQDPVFDPYGTEKNNYTWLQARTYYYQAITTGSEEFFADTFLSLGMVMHLLADASVPAHVRTDPHLVGGDPYEGWAETGYSVWAKSNSGKLDFSGIPVDMSIFDNADLSDPIAPVPISALWDQNRYEMPEPDSRVTKDIDPVLSEIGLAEYANANFFSKDTIFKDYPHPTYTDTDFFNIDWFHPEMVDAEDGQLDSKIYIHGDAGGSEPVRLAAVGYIGYNCMKAGYNKFGAVILDDKVHEDYASRLIPRAVGYSTALLDYFFRGDLEISAPDAYVYSIVDGSTTSTYVDGQGVSHDDYVFTKIKAKVRNNSILRTDGSGNSVYDEAGPGELVAVAKYKRIIDYQPDLSSGAPSKDARENHFSYSVSLPKSVAALSSSTPQEFVFDFSQHPIPAGITDLYLQVVFKGTLGREQEIAVAVGMKDLNEPQHLTFWNDTDYFLLNGVPEKAEDIRRNLDAYLYGFIFPFAFTESVGFSGSEPVGDILPVFTLRDLPPARYGKLIVITDNPNGYYLSDHIEATWWYEQLGTSVTIVNDTFVYFFDSTVCQEGIDGSWSPTPVYQVRGVSQHMRTYFMNFYPYFVYINSLPAPPENALGPYLSEIYFP